MASQPYGMIQAGLNNPRIQAAAQQPFTDAEAYRQALSKAAYGDIAPAFNQGVEGINAQLAGAGPLADSSARAALTSRLASGLYRNAANRVGQGYASYLGNALSARRNYNYQLALMKAQQPSFLQSVTGAVGGALGGIFGRGGGGGGGAYDYTSAAGGYGNTAGDSFYGGLG